MLEISKELKNKVIKLNNELSDKYKDVFNMDKNELRLFIQDNIGDIEVMKKLSKEELKVYFEKNGVVGVDGSKNRIGGAYPHFVEVYQGLAKSSIYKKSSVYKADFYTPMLEEGEKEDVEDEKDIYNYKLSNIEVEAALEALEKFNPCVIIMDGSLIRYDIECFKTWMKLRRRCEKNGTILIGVIKDIKTNIIAGKLQKWEESPNSIYDRELLYGLLQYGEMIKIKENVTKKSKEGFSSCFMRTSKSPAIIGMDILDTQKEYLDEMARLVFTLTPENSRGVPLWIDIVDNEVKISNEMMRSLLNNYLDREVLEKLFISERDKRDSY
jgi:hypothetical protein